MSYSQRDSGRVWHCVFTEHVFTMMTSSNGNIFRVTGPLCGNSPVPVSSPHKVQWRGALMFSLICVWINDWVNNREAGDLRCHRGHYDVNVMLYMCSRSYVSVISDVTIKASLGLLVPCHLFSARASVTTKLTKTVVYHYDGYVIL